MKTNTFVGENGLLLIVHPQDKTVQIAIASSDNPTVGEWFDKEDIAAVVDILDDWLAGDS